MKTNLKLFKVLLLMFLAAVCIATTWGQSLPASPGLPATFIQPKVIEDRSVRAGWQRYQFGVEPPFSVILPVAPDVTAERNATALVNTYLSNKGSAVYGASRLDGIGRISESATEDERQTFFRNFIEGFARGFQEALKKDNLKYEMKLSEPRKVTAAGHEALQQDLTVGAFQGSAQLVFLGSGAFCVFSIWNPETPAADREAFFNSFQLGDITK